MDCAALYPPYERFLLRYRFNERMDAGAFRAGIRHPDPLVIPAPFGGFRCASSTLRYAVESTIIELCRDATLRLT